MKEPLLSNLKDKGKQVFTDPLQQMQQKRNTFPYDMETFLTIYREKLFNFEIEELGKMKSTDEIYFIGHAANRTETELKLLKGAHEN